MSYAFEKNHSDFYFSLFSAAITAYFWLLEFFNPKNHVFGLHFRFLTYWALTTALLVHGLQLVLRGYVMEMKEPQKKLLRKWMIAIGVLNLAVILLYWLAYFTVPGFLGVMSTSIVKDLFVHAISPLCTLIETCFFSECFEPGAEEECSALQSQQALYRDSLMALGKILIAYVLWLEVLIRPYSILPYRFLRHAPFPLRVAVYLGASIVAVALHSVLFLVNKDCKKDAPVLQDALSEDGKNNCVLSSDLVPEARPLASILEEKAQIRVPSSLGGKQSRQSIWSHFLEGAQKGLNFDTLSKIAIGR